MTRKELTARVNNYLYHSGNARSLNANIRIRRGGFYFQ